MAGLLDDIFGGSYSGDDTTRDQYGQTQADRRKPIFSGLVNAGLLAVAGSGDLMPAERAKYIAGAGQALGGIGPAMQEQQTNAAQNMLRQQQMKTSQQKLDAQARMSAFVKTPEGQAAFAKLDPSERAMMQLALDSGDLGHATSILTGEHKMAAQAARLDIANKTFDLKQREADLKMNRPTLKDGNWVYPNGNTWNEVSGWKFYNGQMVPFGQGHSVAPPPGQSGAPAPSAPGAPPAAPAPGGPAVPPPAPGGGPAPPVVPAPAPGGGPAPTPAAPPSGDIDEEIKGWSNTPANAGIPHGLDTSEYDEKRNYAVLGQLPPEVARDVQAAGDYRKRPRSALQQKQNPDFEHWVEMYNPNYDESKYKRVSDIKEAYSPAKPFGSQIVSQGTVYEHLGSLWKDYQALGDGLAGNNTPAARAALQEWQRRTGAPGTAGYEVAQAGVADELAKAMRGPGVLGKEEMDAWEKKFSGAKSPQQIHGAFVSAFDLLEGKERSLKQAFKVNTNLNMKDFLSPEAKAQAQAIKDWKPPGAARQPTQAELADELAKRRKQEQGQ